MDTCGASFMEQLQYVTCAAQDAALNSCEVKVLHSAAYVYLSKHKKYLQLSVSVFLKKKFLFLGSY